MSRPQHRARAATGLSAQCEIFRGPREGQEDGGRQLHDEMFYSAAQPVVNRRLCRAYDWGAAKRMVDRLLGEY